MARLRAVPECHLVSSGFLDMQRYLLAIIVSAWAAVILGMPYVQAYRRRKDLERRGRIKPGPRNDE
jgi:hypothetical protein